MGGVLHRGVFRRHAERVPAHRVQHVEAARALVARHHVAHRVVAHMAHMDAPRRIREHFEHVIFRPRIVVARGEDRLVGPDFLPFLLGFADVVAFGPHVSEVSFSRNVRRTAATKHDLPGGVKSAGRGRASRRWARSRPPLTGLANCDMLMTATLSSRPVGEFMIDRTHARTHPARDARPRAAADADDARHGRGDAQAKVVEGSRIPRS